MLADRRSLLPDKSPCRVGNQGRVSEALASRVPYGADMSKLGS
jgi:hypothetical protein